MTRAVTHRLVAPDDFSSQLARLVAAEDTDAQKQELRRLAEFELDYGQTIQFQHVLRRLPAVALDDLRRCRLALLSNATADHLIPAISVAGLRVGLFFEIYVSPYQQFTQELLDGDSALVEFCPEHVLFSLSPREFLSSLSGSTAPSEVSDLIDDHISGLSSLWEVAKSMLKATVLQQTYLNLGDTLYGNLDRHTPSAPTHAVRCLNQALVEQAGSRDVQVLDLDRLVDRFGLNYWYDNTRWLQAKIEISPRAAGEYADQVTRVVAAHLGMSRKCLVLDLDNTLWGGVVGDDGIQNIVLGQGSAVGEAYLQLQSYVKRLKERGVILAVCSKNERPTAESVFLQHPEMLLSLDDISVFIANWEDKATNIARIADQLNIGLDSLVIVDDNPAERALIRQSFPVVAVPELPADPSQYVDCLANAGYFEAVAITTDDLSRSQQYAQNRQRQSLAQSSQSIDDYLRSLEMRMMACPFVDVDLPRISQLINKTNQFNATTRRKTQIEVRDFASRDENLTLQVRLSDRFGDNGLVSAVMLVPDPTVAGALEIETWVMSCRVFGRQLEYETFNALVELLRETKRSIITGHYIPTPRNSLIQNLYRDLGFTQIRDSNDLKAGETRWIFDLETYSPHQTHIEIVRPK